jgi:hypothetical protein
VSDPYTWAGKAWLEYAKKWANEIQTMRANGFKFTTPLVKGDKILENLNAFYRGCGASCSEESDAAYIDINAINAFCGSWNNGNCAAGANYVVGVAEKATEQRPVYITNWGYIGLDATVELEVEAMKGTIGFFMSGTVERAYWFGARDIGGGSGESVTYLTNTIPGENGKTMGEFWEETCSSLSSAKAAPGRCSAVDIDRWSPDQGGCCSGVAECTEQRSLTDPFYCPASDPKHGSSCWRTIVMCRQQCQYAPTPMPSELPAETLAKSPTEPSTEPPTELPTTPTEPPTNALPAESWTVEAIQEQTVQGDANECYIGIFEGKSCASKGGVYKVSKGWYTGHFGGSFANLGTCGKTIENWLVRSPGHGQFAESLSNNVNLGTHATFISTLACARPAEPMSPHTELPAPSSEPLPTQFEGDGEATQIPISPTLLPTEFVGEADGEAGGRTQFSHEGDGETTQFSKL